MVSNETLCLVVKERPNGCVFWQVETVFLILLGSIAVVLNVLQFRTLFHNRKFRPIVAKDLLTGVLTVVNLFTALVPIFAYVFARHGYSATTTGQIPNNGCVTFYVTFAWSKLCVLFLTAAFVYTSYLQCTNSRSSGTKLYSRTGTLQSQKSFASVNSGTCSCSTTKRLTRDHITKPARYAPRKTISLTLTIVIFGIVFVSLIVSSLPFLGLGPQMNKGAQTAADNLNNNTTNTALETGVCSLRVFVVPQNEKEYTYLFAIIMSSTASFFLQAFCLCACVFHHKTNRKFPRHQLRRSIPTKTTDDTRAEESNEEPSLAKGKAKWPPEELETVIVALVIGMAFFLTWTPLIVTLCLAVAGTMVSERLVTIFLLISFTNVIVDPLVYGGLSRECRKAHKEFFATTIWTKLKNAGSISERTASRVTDQEV